MRSSRPPVVRLALAGLGLLLVVWMASLGAVLAWERHDQSRPVGAIVVLGAAQYVGRPSPSSGWTPPFERNSSSVR